MAQRRQEEPDLGVEIDNVDELLCAWAFGAYKIEEISPDLDQSLE